MEFSFVLAKYLTCFLFILLLLCPCRFKWTHLSERLAYERAVRKQRMNTEIAQAKREANFFSHNVDLSAHLSKRKDKSEKNTEKGATDDAPRDGFFVREYRQRHLDSEIREKKLSTLDAGSIKIKKKKTAHKQVTGPLNDESKDDLLKSLFGSRN